MLDVGRVQVVAAALAAIAAVATATEARAAAAAAAATAAAAAAATSAVNNVTRVRDITYALAANVWQLTFPCLSPFSKSAMRGCMHDVGWVETRPFHTHIV